jgi:Trk K+ transport system NAD-binding subunit
MAGLVFREVRRSFKQGVVCGYVSKSDHSLHLNPGEQQTLELGDRLIVLANDGELETSRCWSTYALHVQYHFHYAI